MNSNFRASTCAAFASVLLGACASSGPSGAEKAAAYHTQEAERLGQSDAPDPVDTTSALALPTCPPQHAPPPFPDDSTGAAFRAIVHLTIAENGKATDVCYLKVEGDRKWEKKALGDPSSWTFDSAYAGEARERTVLWRKR